MITRRHVLLSYFSCTTALMLPNVSQAFPPFLPARFPLEPRNEALNATCDEDQIGKTIIKVIGVGSAGRSMVKHMMADETHGTTFFYANRNTHEIRAALAGTHALFIVAGMGGDTGNDLATELARVAKNMGILTVGIAAMPFVREGADRMNKANAGLAEFETNVDSLIVLRNEEFLSMLGDGVTTDQAIAHANDVLKNTAGNIAKILTQPGHVAVDFEDFRLGLSEAGITQLGFAVASGLDRGRRAAELAVACPLLAHFSDRGHLFQADRGRRFRAIVDAQGMRASEGLNVSQSSKRSQATHREAACWIATSQTYPRRRAALATYRPTRWVSRLGRSIGGVHWSCFLSRSVAPLRSMR